MNSIFNLFNGEALGEVSVSGPLEFVRSLLPTKKSQAQWSDTSLQDRSQVLQKMALEIQAQSQPLALALARSQGLPLDFILQNEVIPAIRAFERAALSEPFPETLPKPMGLIAFIAPEFLTFRFLAERVSAALMAGNAVFIATGVDNALAGQWLKILSKDLPAGLLEVFHGDDSLLEVVCAHPSIAAVCAMGYPKQSEKIMKACSGSWKKLQITSGYHNSALISNEANLSEVAKDLVKSCFTGMGQLHANISNILVTEAQLENFQKEFISALESERFAKNESESFGFGPMRRTDRSRIEELWKTIQSENGKILFGGSIEQSLQLQVKPLVVQDMSHCSVLQQDCLAAPVVLISPVKYVHEMFKWSNTSYFGMVAQVFGPEDKIQKFAPKLDVSRIVGPAWLSAGETLPFGMKQSFLGIPDLNPFGNFFSDLRKIDG
jgi:acyl-CoA reductase-like NAD-dependent aldehyde dehydrogenase